MPVLDKGLRREIQGEEMEKQHSLKKKKRRRRVEWKSKSTSKQNQNMKGNFMTEVQWPYYKSDRSVVKICDMCHLRYVSIDIIWCFVYEFHI